MQKEVRMFPLAEIPASIALGREAEHAYRMMIQNDADPASLKRWEEVHLRYLEAVSSERQR